LGNYQFIIIILKTDFRYLAFVEFLISFYNQNIFFMINRRKAISSLALLSSSPLVLKASTESQEKGEGTFRFCLNTSTISGQDPGLLKYIEIASQAGYDGIEVWVRDVKAHLEQGNSAASLKNYIDDQGITVENAIGFAPWITGGEKGLAQMKEEMELLASIGGKRIAAPPAGVPSDKPLDFFMAGEKYAEILELGRQTGVMPQLEFWGASPVMWHMGQALMVAASANDPDVRLLPDVYHMFRGGSGFDTLKMINGTMIEIFHMNDYVDSIPREQQNDKDRVYPGDGVAPMKRIFTDLKNMGGVKVLSLELFNPDYWKEDPLAVAKTGIIKMKSLTEGI
jgi:sugar phosphate isomerase/epimerase